MAYKWSPKAKIEDVKRHLQSLEAALNFYSTRNEIKMKEVQEEIDSVKSFYKIEP